MKPKESSFPKLGITLIAAAAAALVVLIGCGGSGGTSTTGTTGLTTGTGSTGSTTTGGTTSGGNALAYFPANSILFTDNGGANTLVEAVAGDGTNKRTILTYLGSGASEFQAGNYAAFAPVQGGLFIPYPNDASGTTFDLYYTRLASSSVPGSPPVQLSHQAWLRISSIQPTPDQSSIIVCASPVSGEYNIYEVSITNTSGTPSLGTPRLITEGFSPYLGSDGKTIVYVSQASPTADTQIATINIDGSGQKAITTDNAYHYGPQFNKAMTQVAWTQTAPGSGSSQGATEVWTASIDGQQASQVTQLNKAGVTSPCFSPDGTKIGFVYYQFNDKASGIYVVPSSAHLATPSVLVPNEAISPNIVWSTAAGGDF